MPTSTLLTRLTAVAAATLALGLAACGQRDDRTVGQKIDGAIATAEQKAEQAKADVQRESAQAQASAEAAASKLADKAEATAQEVKGAVSDAAVTASVNAELAKDPDLSALRIDVDTNGGRVLLSGTAPSAEARDRATRLAQAVQGVVSVENRLSLRS